MKENKEANDAFVLLHETMAEEGKTREEIISECITRFSLGGSNSRHTYRAWVSRLADPQKYEGRYSERMRKFQLNRNNKTKTKPPEAADPQPASDDVVAQVEVGS